MLRIGHGFDAHRFGNGNFVTLGGVKIPHEKKLIAHSDGDVVLHALCDALLGAAAMGDIGHWFPDTDSQFANTASSGLLCAVNEQLLAANYRIHNADVTAIAEAPRLAPHIYSMRHNIARLLTLDIDCISIKATTTEGMGYIGRKEGIAAIATVLIERFMQLD